MLLRSILGAIALACAPAPALAGDPAPSRCVDIATPKKAIEARNGKWVQLTSEQWEFLRGVFSVNPETPPGLPLGDKAMMAKAPENPGALIFWIDGDKACDAMPIPKELVEMLFEVGDGTPQHERGGL